ncbi:glycosyltransferase family 2 protein [Tautonia marina]|uniref:glycosyltransferase family 2 protein n=1 Tax=Tautonia marina TaxID=2653855 RepID=UPI0013764A66|nr:glycosyltransferase family 2 protein [Tautonia marina]
MPLEPPTSPQRLTRTERERPRTTDRGMLTSPDRTAAPFGVGPAARPASTASAWPFVTVIVPVRNEEPFIARTLEQLMAQDYPPECFEVLVVDGRSTDATRSIVTSWAQRFPHLRLLENPRRLSSAARNLGIAQARGQIILIVDGHCELDGPTYLRAVAEAFDRSGADCLGRPQPLDVRQATTLQKAIAAARSSWLGHHPASFIYADAEQFVPAKSVAVAYRRAVFDQVGPFDESFDACEDVELNHRIDQAGLRCYFTPRIRARYVPRSSLAGLFRQMARYGRGRMRLLRKHPETFSLGSFVPAFWLVGVLGGLPVCIVWPALRPIYLGVLLAYGFLLLLASAHVGLRSRQARLAAIAPLVYLTVHAGTGWGILRESIRFAPEPGVPS